MSIDSRNLLSKTVIAYQYCIKGVIMSNCNRRIISMLLITFIMTISLITNSIFSCARILKANNGQAVMVGRNMDWQKDMQTNLWVYPQGLARDGMASVNSLKWTSKYGSIVATAYDMITTDGMNEKGMAAHLLSLPESDYGKRNEKLSGMSVLLWAQYYLDNFQTVDEAVRFTERASIQLLPFYDSNIKKYVNVHLALEDAMGDSAIIEYTNGNPTIYHNRAYRVLTNSPTYDQQLINIKQYQGFGGDKPLPGTTDPKDRFVRAAYYTEHLSTESSSDREAVAEILSVMQNVGQPYGIPTLERPIISRSIWRVVANLTQHIYYFNSLTSFNIIWLQLDKFKLLPGSPIMKLDVVNNPDLVGDVTNNFFPVS